MKKAKQFSPKSSGLGSRRSFNGRSAVDSLYDLVWEKYSKAFLKENPKCYACGSFSQAVDHIRPHKSDKDLFQKLDNHLPLCHKCHNTITAKFDRYYKPGQPITDKLRWISAKRSEHGVTVRVRVMQKYGQMVTPARFERATHKLETCCSIP